MYITVVEILNDVSTITTGGRENVYATDHAFQEIKVECSIRWGIEFNIASDLIPTPLLIHLSNEDLKHLFC